MLRRMKRVVPTASGFVQIDYSGKGWGSVDVYDRDGWHVDGRVFGLRGYPADARDVLSHMTSLSRAEVEQVVAETEQQHTARGGDDAALDDARLPTSLRRAFIVAGLLMVFALALLVLMLL